MDVSQLRQAFLGSSTAYEKAEKLSKRWTYDTVTAVERFYEDQSAQAFDQGETKTVWDREEPSPKDGILTLHIIPIGSMLDQTSLPIEELEGKHGVFCPLVAMGCEGKINLKGVQYFLGNRDVNVYTQLHRFGAVEVVAEQLVWQRDGGRELLGRKINQELKDKLPGYLKGMRELGASPPLFIKMQLSRVKNSTLETGSPNAYYTHGEPEFVGRSIELPGIVLTDYPDAAKINVIGKELLDPLWNAYGRARCSYFDDEGVWLDSI